MLEDLIKEYKIIKEEIETQEDLLQGVRKQIIDIMEKTNLEKAEYKTGKATLSHPKGFDSDACKEGNPEEYNEFLTVETIEVEKFDDKAFGLAHPELINRYMKPQTPRLTIK